MSTTIPMTLEEKESEIEIALNEQNVWKLRELALANGGFLNGAFFHLLFFPVIIV